MTQPFPCPSMLAFVPGRGLTRRGTSWLVVAACIGWSVLGIAGCRQESTPEDVSGDAAPPTASTVPLRIVSTASAEFNERMERGWEAVSEQPLDIAAATSTTLGEQAEQADVILFHNAEMGELQAADALTPLAESYLQSEGVDADSFLPGLRSSSMIWGDEVYALPLGTSLPAVWIGAGAEAPESLTWESYQELIAALPDGRAAEPLADGWAAIALLQRASSLTSATWLFDRNTLEPVLETPPYVRALEQLVASRKRYPEALMTPEQVWRGLQAGELQVVIGWPASGDVEHSTAPRLLPYPTAEEVFISEWEPAELVPRPPLVSSKGLLAGLAASCRQTSAARGFIAWLSGREGHAAVRGASSNLAANRRDVPQSDRAGLPVGHEGEVARGTYDEYVIRTLSDGQVRPSLRLPAADEYLAALDAQVVLALEGEIEPAEALAAAAREWEAITESHGRRHQLRAWQLSQGLRGRG